MVETHNLPGAFNCILTNIVGREGFGKQKISCYQRGRCNAGGNPKGSSHPMACGEPAEQWPQNKSQSDHGVQYTELLYPFFRFGDVGNACGGNRICRTERSEEHTSELQSLMRSSYAVFCLKKKKINKSTRTSCIDKTTN